MDHSSGNKLKPGALTRYSAPAETPDAWCALSRKSVDHLVDLLRYGLSKLTGVERLDSTICLKPIRKHGALATWAMSAAA